MKAKVFVTLKNSVLDPQGKAIENALKANGFSVEGVRQGKMIEVILPKMSRNDAYSIVQQMCVKLLVNTTIENYSFEIIDL